MKTLNKDLSVMSRIVENDGLQRVFYNAKTNSMLVRSFDSGVGMFRVEIVEENGGTTRMYVGTDRLLQEAGEDASWVFLGVV